MGFEEETLGKVSEIVARVVKPRAEPEASKAATKLVGTGNVVGNGNVVLVVGSAANDAPINGQAKADLDDLVNEVVFHESLKRGKPYRKGSVWMAVRKALNLSPRLLEADRERIERYLRGWLGRAAAVGADEAAGHDEKWRKRRVARVLSTCKELDRQRQLEQLLAQRYGAAVLIELSDDQLDEVFRMVSSWA